MTFGKILTDSSYRPWDDDAEFIKAHQSISPFTMVDMHRCYEIWQCVQSVRGISGDLIEIGTWKGGTGALMSIRSDLDANDADVYLCDTFSGVVKATEEDPVYIGGEHSDTSEDEVAQMLSSVGAKRANLLKGVFPDQTGEQISGKRFRFCHIDVDVYQSAKDCCEWVWPRLNRGGIVVYDDFGFFQCRGVTKWVLEQSINLDRHTFYNLNGHAVVVKL